jgi:hypothetical protein
LSKSFGSGRPNEMDWPGQTGANSPGGTPGLVKRERLAERSGQAITRGAGGMAPSGLIWDWLAWIFAGIGPLLVANACGKSIPVVPARGGVPTAGLFQRVTETGLFSSATGRPRQRFVGRGARLRFPRSNDADWVIADWVIADWVIDAGGMLVRDGLIRAAEFEGGEVRRLIGTSSEVGQA